MSDAKVYINNTGTAIRAQKLTHVISNCKQVSCKLECRIRKALDRMRDGEKCIPWFLPPVDPDARLCSPYETRRFKKEMESPDSKNCEV